MPSKKKKRPLKDRRRRARLLLAAALASVLLSLVVGALIGLRRPEIAIQSVEVSGTHYTRADLVKQGADDLLAGYYFFLIPRANAFFYPHDRIVKDIMGLFKPVQDVRVYRDGFTSLRVDITERTPIALWCGPGEAPPDCFLMDEGGFVFNVGEAASSSPFVRYEGRLSGDLGGSPLGNTYLPGEFAAFREFLGKLALATGRTIVRVSVDEYEDVFVFFKEGGEIRFTKAGMRASLLDNIASVFASDRFHSDDVFEYADFRFGSKIYVKFEGE